MKKIPLSIIFVLLLTSCSDVSDKPTIISQLVKDRIKNIETIDDLFTIREVDLITKGKVTIKNITGGFTVDIAGNIYFAGGSSEIYKFDSMGNYIGKLRKIGRGPGEYIRFNTFFVDDDQLIFIDNNFNKSILKYNKDFNFVGNIKKESLYPLIQIGKYQDYLIGYAPTEKNEPIALYNKKTQSQMDAMGIKNSDAQKYGVSIFDGGFDIYKNKIYYTFPEQYQIFVVENKKVIKLLNSVPSHFEIPQKKIKSLKSIRGKKIPITYAISVEKDFLMLSYTTDFLSKNREVLFDIYTLSGKPIRTQIPAKMKRNFRKYAPGKYIAYNTFDSDEEDFTIKVYLFELKE